MTDASPIAVLPDAPLAVIGTGTMGAGIAQVAATGGFDVLLYDAVEGAAEAAGDRVAAHVARLVEKERMTQADADAANARLRPVDEIADLRDCFMVIEAAPERLELKQELFKEVAGACGPDTVLATNTSSLPVTAIASAVPGPERVVGMHFFNPVPLMRLVEVVAGLATGERAVAIAHAVVDRFGKQSIDAADVAGFLVNRVSRPFLLEAQRLLQDGVADHEVIDRVVRLGGGFRMGPFELSDLVGVDVGFEIAQSFQRLSFGEPRWQPSPVAAQLVAAGRHGRKAGHGYYRYEESTPYRAPDPDPLLPESASGAVIVLGDTKLANELRRLAGGAGYEVTASTLPTVGHTSVLIDARLEDCGTELDEFEVPRIVLCASGSLAQIARGADLAGFHCLPPLAESHLVEIVAGGGTSKGTVAAAEHFFHSLGKHTQIVGDGPGLVLGRIVCQLVNEAAFAVQESVGSVADIDRGVELGLNYPRGLLAWGDTIGVDHVLHTLDALQFETGSDRYRPAALLRRMAAEDRAFRDG